MPPRRDDSAAIVPAGQGGFGRLARGAAMAAVPGVAAALRSRSVRSAVRALGDGQAGRRRGPLTGELLGAPAPRHPLAPAALRVERTRIGGAQPADQVALTVWFGEGPALPAPAPTRSAGASLAVRLGASIAGAAAVAALTAVAARLAEQEHPTIVDARPG